MEKKLEKIVEMGNIYQKYLDEFLPDNEAKKQSLLRFNESIMWAYRSIKD